MKLNTLKRRNKIKPVFWLVIPFFFFHHFLHTSTFQLLDKPWSQVLSFLPPGACLESSTFIANRVQQSHCSSIFYRVLLTHALALFASQFVHTKKTPRVYTSIYALGGIRSHETDLYTTLEDNLIRHRGDRGLLLHNPLYFQRNPPFSLLFPFDWQDDQHVCATANMLFIFRFIARFLVHSRFDRAHATSWPSGSLGRCSVRVCEQKALPGRIEVRAQTQPIP